LKNSFFRNYRSIEVKKISHDDLRITLNIKKEDHINNEDKQSCLDKIIFKNGHDKNKFLLRLQRFHVLAHF
jgi:hypothetical protein